MKSAVPISVTAAVTGLSNKVDLGQNYLAGIVMSATWTTAAITFLGATTLGGTFGSLYDDQNDEITIAAADAVQGVTLLFSDALQKKLRAVRCIQIRSGIAGAAVQQGGVRVLTLLTV